MPNGGEYALEHKTRRMIYNYILEHPGVSFGRIRKVFDLTKGTLRYHLNYLKKKDKIDSKLESGKRCYYSAQTAKKTDPSEGRNLNPKQKHLLNAIRDNPGATKKELVKKTRIKSSTAAYCLRRLVELKLVWKIKKGHETGYELITQKDLIEELDNLLLARFLAKEIDEKTYFELKERLKKRS